MKTRNSDSAKEDCGVELEKSKWVGSATAAKLGGKYNRAWAGVSRGEK